MLIDDIYQNILINPQDQADRVVVVSGYASPAMVFRHFSDISPNISIDLIVGKAISDGLYLGQHDAFCAQQATYFTGRFNCKYYIADKAGLHSKTYLWYKGDTPVQAFVGSANYSQNGFFSNQVETMTDADPKDLHQFVADIVNQSKNCGDNDITNFITLHEKPLIKKPLEAPAHSAGAQEDLGDKREAVTISLLVRGGETPARSGINWGQRDGRDPDQAYLSIPATIQRTDFFPPRGDCFVIHCDDGFLLECKRAQDEGKAIETYKNNAILGKYIRERIGLASGEYVSRNDLKSYGRTNVSIYKIDSESYYMDFSVG